MDRNTTMTTIRSALRERSGKSWSVTGGRGTSYGWLTITAPPARRVEYGYMTDEDRAELGRLLGKDGPCHMQGELVPASNAHYREFTARAQGKPFVVAEQYWD